MSESIPGTIGKYQIIREIARSNDIVYEAYDPKMTRRVAVKELAMPKGVSGQQRQDRLKRFEREARAAGSLVHPNIVTIYEVGTDGDKNYIAMEFLTGRNLRKEIDKTGFIEPLRAVEIAIEVLEGLAFAHEHGVIHRDIKPDNVQLLDDGQIKLTDFGIARLTFEPNITMDGQVFGTPSYMSPEQINGQEIDARSDLFGVGVLLYEMVSGQKPFQGDSVVSITYAVMNKKPDRPQQASYNLWQVIERALEKTPNMRYKSAGEFVEALKQVKRSYLSGSVVMDPVNTQGFVQPAQLMAGPPPVYNPFLSPQPFAAQPVNRTPYGTPMPGMPGGFVPPPNQQYVPYQPQGQYAPYQPPATGQVPVYYPPPPRQPLIKPETKQGIAKFFIAVLLIGATIGFVILVINALTNTVPGAARSQPKDQPLAKNFIGVDGQTPQGAPPDKGAPVQSRPSTGSAPNTQGGPGPVNPGPVVLVGQINDLLKQADRNVDEASVSESSELRQKLWSDADTLYVQAIDKAVVQSDKDGLGIRASNKYVQAAESLIRAGYRDRAREAYRHAKGFAESDQGQADQIDKAIEALGG